MRAPIPTKRILGQSGCKLFRNSYWSGLDEKNMWQLQGNSWEATWPWACTRIIAVNGEICIGLGSTSYGLRRYLEAVWKAFKSLMKIPSIYLNIDICLIAMKNCVSLRSEYDRIIIKRRGCKNMYRGWVMPTENRKVCGDYPLESIKASDSHLKNCGTVGNNHLENKWWQVQVNGKRCISTANMLGSKSKCPCLKPPTRASSRFIRTGGSLLMILMLHTSSWWPCHRSESFWIRAYERSSSNLR